MPHEWNNLMVVTKEELVPNWYSYANLKITIYRTNKRGYGLKQVRIGGNGRVALYDFDTLPAQIQQGLGDPRNVKHVFEPCYSTDKEAVAYFRKFQLPDGSYLSDDLQDRYIINSSVFKAIICFRAAIEKERKRKGQNTTGIIEVLRVHTIEFQKTLKVKHKCEHTIPSSDKRFKQALNAFETRGYASLVSGKIGNDNRRKVHTNELGLLESLFATDTTKPSPTDVHRLYEKFLNGDIEIINNNTGEIYNPADFKRLSDGTIKKYLTSWQSKIGTYEKRSGDRQIFMGGFKPYASTNKPNYASSLISIDDRQLPFVMPDGKRVWAYVAVDVASGAYVCVVYGKTKEGIIIEFYRQLVRNFAEWGLNMPYGLECESSLNSSFVNTFLAEGAMFQCVRIEANNARGKIIENFNGTMRYGLEKFEEGFKSRPFARRESNQAGGHEVKIMHFDEIVEMSQKNYSKWNNMPHDTKADLTHWEGFMQTQHPELPPTNYNAILPHLGYKTHTSCNTGIIKLQNNEFLLGDDGKICFGDTLINLMKRVEGRDIIVYWLDKNDGTVLKALIYFDNRLICEAVPKPKFNRAKNEWTAADHQAYEDMNKYISTIQAYGKMVKNKIEPITIIDNTPKLKGTFVMPGFKPQAIINGWETTTALPDTTGQYDDVVQSERTYTKSLKDRLNSH